MQEADRMPVAIHPSETRPLRTAPQAPRRGTLRIGLGVLGGGAALAVFTAGAFSFFSGLADPRARAPRAAPAAPVASQWPDLKDGVPALASIGTERPAAAAPFDPIPAPELSRAVLPVAEAPALPALPATPAKAEPLGSARTALPIEAVQTIPAARTASLVAPAKVAPALPPSRAETVRAREEQPSRFVSLPAPKVRPESPRPDASQQARKPGPARSRVTEAQAAAEPPAPQAAPQIDRDGGDEPELLGVKIPGGRQIRAGWNAAVDGLLGGSSEGQ